MKSKREKQTTFPLTEFPEPSVSNSFSSRSGTPSVLTIELVSKEAREPARALRRKNNWCKYQVKHHLHNGKYQQANATISTCKKASDSPRWSPSRCLCLFPRCCQRSPRFALNRTWTIQIIIVVWLKQKIRGYSYLRLAELEPDWGLPDQPRLLWDTASGSWGRLLLPAAPPLPPPPDLVGPCCCSLL